MCVEAKAAHTFAPAQVKPFGNAVRSELGSLGGRATQLLAEDGGTPGGLELGHLVAEVLGVGRDAGIAVNHAHIVHQKSASEKANLVSGLALMQIP